MNVLQMLLYFENEGSASNLCTHIYALKHHLGTNICLIMAMKKRLKIMFFRKITTLP